MRTRETHLKTQKWMSLL